MLDTLTLTPITHPIASKLPDVRLHPLQRRQLIPQSEVARAALKFTRFVVEPISLFFIHRGMEN